MSLSKDLLGTIAYYDVFGLPLTAFEIWEHRIVMDGPEEDRRVSLRDIVRALGEDALAGRIDTRDGFYFLKGHGNLVDSRLRKDKISSAKLKRVRRLARLLPFVPFVRMVGVTGSLAMKQSDTESDWDLFVVLKEGRIWTGRTILTGFLHMIGKRRHGEWSRDRACLNYYVALDRLEISSKDLFSANEYRFLIPIVGEDVFRRFELRNRWIADLQPNFHPTELLPLWYRPEPSAAPFIQRFLERLLDSSSLESALGRWQKGKIERNPKTKWEGAHIEATDSALIFLPRPRGPRHFEKFTRLFAELRIGK